MIELDTLRSVVSQYERFGWRLERILLKDLLENVSAEFAEIPITLSRMNALWFSRESENGRAWELRRLSGTPFALVRIIDRKAAEAERDNILRETEIEMEGRD